jgi:hypothetical protein
VNVWWPDELLQLCNETRASCSHIGLQAQASSATVDSGASIRRSSAGPQSGPAGQVYSAIAAGADPGDTTMSIDQAIVFATLAAALALFIWGR